MTSITVFGAGSWGTALADLLARNGYQTRLWCRRPEQARAINVSGKNPRYLKEADLCPALSAVSDLEEAVSAATRYVMAIPTQSVRPFLETAAGLLPPRAPICNAAKGMEISTGKLVSEIVAELKPDARYSVLSGPSHAEEVVKGQPTAVVIASAEETEAVRWQQIVTGKMFRAYTSPDVTGVEIGAAVKNVIAVASGMARAKGMGDNALAALVSRGLAEVMRLGAKKNANPLTLAGLAGVGDLMVTCYSTLSRNYRLGYAIGQGKTLEQAREELGQVAEGAHTVDALVRHAAEIGVELPLAEAVYGILYRGVSPEETVARLFARELKPELPPEMFWRG